MVETRKKRKDTNFNHEKNAGLDDGGRLSYPATQAASDVNASGQIRYNGLIKQSQHA